MQSKDENVEPFEKALSEGAQALGLSLTGGQLGQLLGFLGLLQKWNKVYNLTSVRDPNAMVSLHILDSLAAVAPLQRHLSGLDGVGKQALRLLDVGSGGGLPGVVFAICFPELAVHCVDAVGKKAAFVQQAALSLGLLKLRGIHARVESLSERYPIVSSRAFASLADFTGWSGGALEEGGVWLAMKGKFPGEEVDALPATVAVFHVEQLRVPNLDAERCIVWMRRVGAVQSPAGAVSVT